MNATAVTAPVVLTIAGSDSSAGAGVQADLKSISALGGYGINAVTSVVSEVPGLVSRLQLLEPGLIEDQIRVLLGGFPVGAIKTGMLGGAAQAARVAALLRELAAGIPLVVDPVMVATGGGRLLEEPAVGVLTREVLPLAAVITPNMDEAGVLWDRPVGDRAEMEACARELADRFGAAVLVKGGHLTGDAADVLCHAGGVTWLEGRRVEGVVTHGTGCSFSAAIATGLARGRDLVTAVQEAKEFVSRAIGRHLQWTSPGGGVVHALNHLDLGDA
jgi:hydroxymethylpyrimidine/phosphomethylpyrimidine kinase